MHQTEILDQDDKNKSSRMGPYIKAQNKSPYDLTKLKLEILKKTEINSTELFVYLTCLRNFYHQ
jgi:hypothetical protein